MNDLRTFYNRPELKEKLLHRIGEHEKYDAIARGSYESWTATRLGGMAPKRCAVGCSVRDLWEAGTEPADWHEAMQDMFAIPEWLAYLEDAIFEGMPFDASKGWPRRFAEAIPVGVPMGDLSPIMDRLSVQRLRLEVMPLVTR